MKTRNPYDPKSTIQRAYEAAAADGAPRFVRPTRTGFATLLEQPTAGSYWRVEADATVRAFDWNASTGTYVELGAL